MNAFHTGLQCLGHPATLLSILRPAWQLWTRPKRALPKWTIWVALALSALAMMGHTCGPAYRVERVVVVNETVYIGLRVVYGDASDKPIEGERVIARSDDGGETWTAITDAPADVIQALNQEVSLPAVVCDPASPHICYRISGQEQVEESRDGGQTWQVAWSIPWGRRGFVERYIATTLLCKSIDLVPHDLALLNKHGSPILIVAIGNEGVLVRTSDGVWQRYRVLDAYPTPYGSAMFLPSLLPETSIWLAAAFFTLLGLCAWSWRSILNSVQSTLSPKRSILWAIRPAFWVIPIPLSWMLGVGNRTVGGLPSLCVFPGAILAASVLVTLDLFFTWRRVASVAHRPEMAWRAARGCALTMIGIFPLAWLPFFLWNVETIPVYEIALVLSLLLAGWVLRLGIRRVRQASQLAGTPLTSSS